MADVKVGEKYTVVWDTGTARGIRIERLEYGMAVGKDPKGNTRSFAIKLHRFIREP